MQSAGWGFLMPILGFHFGGLELRIVNPAGISKRENPESIQRFGNRE